MKEIIRTDNAPAPSGTYSQAVKLGNLVFVSGTCPFELGTGRVLHPNDMGEQTRAVLRYIQEILQAAGTSLDHVVKTTVFINELDRFQEFNRAYSEFFPKAPPSRSTEASQRRRRSFISVSRRCPKW